MWLHYTKENGASLAWAVCGFIPTVVDWAVFLLVFVFISCLVTEVTLLATLYTCCCLVFEDSLCYAYHLSDRLALIKSNSTTPRSP